MCVTFNLIVVVGLCITINLERKQTLIFGFLIVIQKDSYKSTGCFDLTCHGFVQIATEFAIGSNLAPYSRPFNQQYEINIGLFQVMITCVQKIS
jgi:hypothetical protein